MNFIDLGISLEFCRFVSRGSSVAVFVLSSQKERRTDSFLDLFSKNFALCVYIFSLLYLFSSYVVLHAW